MRRAGWTVAGALLLVAAALLVRGCGDDVARTAAAGTAVPDATAGVAAPAADDDALATQRHAAFRGASTTLQAYLAVLPDGDAAKIDAYWAGGGPPADSGEADLRDLPKALRSMRSDTGTPQALDRLPVPAAMEIPVELHLRFDDSSRGRYAGRYRLRRAIDGERWEITSAAVDAAARRE